MNDLRFAAFTSSRRSGIAAAAYRESAAHVVAAGWIPTARRAMYRLGVD